jgi:hypothetical protein
MKTTPLAALILFGLAQPALANIDIQFDYSYDTGYFTGANAGRQAALNAAASVFESRLTDTLGAITVPDQFGMSFFNPGNPTASSDITLSDQIVPSNVIRVYVGGYSVNNSSLGYGGPGGYDCSSAACIAAANRGQANTSGASATDFGPWGGAITFNFGNNTNWNFSTANPGSSQFDLYSVAVHELGHVLGFGTADSFVSKVSNHQFTGNASGTVSLDSYDAHWVDGTKSTVNGIIAQVAAMTPYLVNGQRQYFTELDFAALKDIGWQVSAVPEPETWAMFIAGLGMLVLVARQRRR